MCVAPVLDLGEVTSLPHFRERGVVVDVGEANGHRTVQVEALPFLGERPGAASSLSPAAGADTDSVLAELGFDERAIDELRSSRALA